MIYILRVYVNDYRSFTMLADENNLEKWEKWRELFLSPRKFSNIWAPPKFFFFSGEKGERRKEARKPIPDFSGGYVVDCCSERAKGVIEKLTGDQVEFLPIHTPVGMYYEMNLPIVDCLDESKSEVKRFPSGKVMRIIRYSIHWERVEKHHLFWIKENGHSPAYVSEEMKQLLESSHFPELSFTPIPLVDETSVPKG